MSPGLQPGLGKFRTLRAILKLLRRINTCASSSYFRGAKVREAMHTHLAENAISIDGLYGVLLRERARSGKLTLIDISIRKL